MAESKAMGIIEFANYCGVSKQAVSNACKKERLPIDAMGKLDSKHPDCVAYYEKHNGGSVVGEDIGAGGDSETGEDIRNRFTSGAKSSPGPAPERPAQPVEDDKPKKITRRELEMRKLEMQGDNLDLKNRQIRGSLANVKFYDELFHTQLAAAIKNFKNLPNSCVDGLISQAVINGTDARAPIVADMTERINEILEDVRVAWDRNLDRAENDLIGLIEDE